MTDIATGKRVTFTSPDRGVDFHYTTDGTKPTEASPTARYIDLETAGIYAIQVIAVKGQQQSAVALRNVEVLQVATPSFTIENDWGGKRVKFPTSTAGATVYYTIDETNPDDTKTSGSSYFINYVTAGVTVKAIAYREGYAKSAIATSSSIEVKKLLQPEYERRTSGSFLTDLKAWFFINYTNSNIMVYPETLECYYYSGNSASGNPTTKASFYWFESPRQSFNQSHDTYFRTYCRAKGFVNSDILTLMYYGL